MIILRNDDILKDTSAKKYKGKEVERFNFINRMINETNGELVHRPTIICSNLEKFPEAIELIKAETQLGRMDPQLHGWEHLDYVNRPPQEIESMIKRSQDWFEENLGVRFTLWATCWGGYNRISQRVCDRLGVEIQSTKGTLRCGNVIEDIKNGKKEELEGKTILYHWWQRGLNIFRLCEMLKYGSWEAAKAQDKRGWF